MSGEYPKDKKVVFDRCRKLLYFNWEKYQLSKHIYYYLAPAKSKWQRWDGRVNWNVFAILLHNAKLFCGIAPRMDDLFLQLSVGIPSGESEKAKAEYSLERVRRDNFPGKPSRLACFFLNHSKDVAEYRRTIWPSFKDRQIESCYIVLTGEIFVADVRIYEALTKDPSNLELAKSYWRSFIPKSKDDWYYAEILTDSNLYFPNWKNFSFLELNSIALHYRIERDLKSKSSKRSR